MATVIWKGDTTPIAQVVTVTVGGTVESTDVFTMTIGSKTLTVIAGSTTLATVATNIVTAWNALSATLWPEFREITAAATSGGAFTLTHNTAGVPFTVTLATTETGGGGADAQTFTQSTTTSPDGPAFWSSAANWVGGAVPVNSDDVVIQGTSNSILYGIDQSSGPLALTSLTIDRSFTGTIGLPVYNSNGYREYRETYLKLNATTVTIGGGIGGGSGRIKINLGTAQTTAKVIFTGQPLESGVKAVILKGTHASNSLTVISGSVAVAPFASETSTLATLNIGYENSQDSDSDVLLGSGVTLSSCTITKTGGILDVSSNYSALTQYAGRTTVNGSATKGTTTVLGGRFLDKSTGTGTAMTAGSGGVIEKDITAATYTNTTLRAGGGLIDPAKKITFTNPFSITCALKDLLVLDLGNTFSLQRS